MMTATRTKGRHNTQLSLAHTFDASRKLMETPYSAVGGKNAVRAK